MTFKDPNGVTTIRPDMLDNLAISKDYDDEELKPFPVLLFTPDMNYTTEHYHIALDREQAVLLRDWLTAFLLTTEQ